MKQVDLIKYQKLIPVSQVHIQNKYLSKLSYI